MITEVIFDRWSVYSDDEDVEGINMLPHGVKIYWSSGETVFVPMHRVVVIRELQPESRPSNAPSS